MKELKIFIILFCVSIGSKESMAQNNIHYSQFYNAPVYLNPALTGQLNGDLYRLNAHARNQWSGIQGADGKFLYETKSGGADVSLFKDKLGLGLYVLQDVAGGGIFSTIQIMPSASYSFIMGDNNKNAKMVTSKNLAKAINLINQG